MYKSVALLLLLYISGADFITQESSKGATLKPLSVCCDIPEIGEAKHLAACSKPEKKGLCNEVQCIFQESGFLIDKDNLNREVYKNHLLKWAEAHNGWSIAVEKAIRDCVDADPRQHLKFPCKAYDVFTCTGIALLKKCPVDAWKC